mgnify:CR=1 FL=1
MPRGRPRVQLAIRQGACPFQHPPGKLPQAQGFRVPGSGGAAPAGGGGEEAPIPPAPAAGRPQAAQTQGAGQKEIRTYCSTPTVSWGDTSRRASCIIRSFPPASSSPSAREPVRSSTRK